MRGIPGALAEASFPDYCAFHAQIHEHFRRLRAYPGSHLLIHLLPYGPEISQLPMVPRNELPVRYFGFWESLSNKLPQMMSKAKRSQAHPGHPARIDGAKNFFHGLPVIGFPPLIINERIEMESQFVAPFLTLKRRSQACVKSRGPKLL